MQMESWVESVLSQRMNDTWKMAKFLWASERSEEREGLSERTVTISPRLDRKSLAERVGFEPTLPCGKHAFQACAFSHSAISPQSESTLRLYHASDLTGATPARYGSTAPITSLTFPPAFNSIGVPRAR